MSDFFNDFNKIFQKDLYPIFVKYFKDPNNKISQSINDLLNDPRIFLNEIFEKFSKNKDIDINRTSYTDIENVTDIDVSFDDEYEELLNRLIVIEENMIKIEKILKTKIDKI